MCLGKNKTILQFSTNLHCSDGIYHEHGFSFMKKLYSFVASASGLDKNCVLAQDGRVFGLSAHFSSLSGGQLRHETDIIRELESQDCDCSNLATGAPRFHMDRTCFTC